MIQRELSGGVAAADTWRLATASFAPSAQNAPGKIRTCDLCLRRAALYPLSYGRGEGKSSCAAVRSPMRSFASRGTSTLT